MTFPGAGLGQMDAPWDRGTVPVSQWDRGTVPVSQIAVKLTSHTFSESSFYQLTWKAPGCTAIHEPPGPKVRLRRYEIWRFLCP